MQSPFSIKRLIPPLFIRTTNKKIILFTSQAVKKVSRINFCCPDAPFRVWGYRLFMEGASLGEGSS
jgi:hypothetical protein